MPAPGRRRRVDKGELEKIKRMHLTLLHLAFENVGVREKFPANRYSPNTKYARERLGELVELGILSAERSKSSRGRGATYYRFTDLGRKAFSLVKGSMSLFARRLGVSTSAPAESFTTGDEDLDRILGGGMRRGCLYALLFPRAASGREYVYFLLYKVAIASQLPTSRGGSASRSLLVGRAARDLERRALLKRVARELRAKSPWNPLRGVEILTYERARDLPEAISEIPEYLRKGCEVVVFEPLSPSEQVALVRDSYCCYGHRLCRRPPGPGLERSSSPSPVDKLLECLEKYDTAVVLPLELFYAIPLQSYLLSYLVERGGENWGVLQLGETLGGLLVAPAYYPSGGLDSRVPITSCGSPTPPLGERSRLYKWR